MSSLLEAVVPVAWTYVNGNALLRLDIVEVGRVLHLLVSGAEHAESYQFPDRQALLTYRSRREAQLQAQGYTLAATSHQRRGGDRRRHPQSGRRRQPMGSR